MIQVFFESVYSWKLHLLLFLPRTRFIIMVFLNCKIDSFCWLPHSTGLWFWSNWCVWDCVVDDLLHASPLLFCEIADDFIICKKEFSEYSLSNGGFRFGEESNWYDFIDAEDVPDDSEEEHDLWFWVCDGYVGDVGLDDHLYFWGDGEYEAFVHLSKIKNMMNIRKSLTIWYMCLFTNGDYWFCRIFLSVV